MSNNNNSTPKSAVVAKSVPSNYWVTGLFITVVAVAMLGTVSENSGGIVKLAGNFLAGSSLVGPTGQNQALQSIVMDGKFKTLFPNENYHRCQNKLGSYGVVLAPSATYNDAQTRTIFANQFSIGQRYTVVDIENLGPVAAGDAIIENSKLMLQAARDNFVVPIINIRSFTGDPPVDLPNYYTLISENGNPFVATTVPDQITTSGDISRTILTSETVAKAIYDLPNILIASPILRLHPDKTIDALEYYANAGFNNNNRLDLGQRNMYDIIMVSAQNYDSDFKNLSPNSQGGTSEYYAKSAHWVYSDSEGGQRFTTKQLIRDRNRSDIVVATNLDIGREYFAKPFTQAIIMDFAPAPLTYPNGVNDSLLERMEYDFTRFTADPTVMAVVFSRQFEAEVTSQRESDGWEAYKARLVKAGTNCNYDIVQYEYEFEPRSIARSCSVEPSEANGNKQVSTRVVCKPDQNNGVICSAQIDHTVQVGLPIRHCGSNSPLGTDTKPFRSLASRVNSAIFSPIYDASNQFASGIKINGVSETYMVPWLGNCINNSGQLMKLFGFNRVSEPNGAALRVLGRVERELEQQRVEQEEYDSQSLYAYSPYNVSADLQELYPDELVVYFGSRLGVHKDSQIAQQIRTFDPTQESRSSNLVNTCGGDVQLVAQNPQNLVYGSEMIIKSDEWSGTGAEMCYELAKSDGRLSGNAQCSNTFATGCVCESWNTAAWGAATPPTLTLENVRNNIACRANPELVNRCVRYVSGADSYVRSTVSLAAEQPTPGNIEIDGVYDALAESYTQLQEIMSVRGQKMVFREKRGWEAESIVRSYSIVDPAEPNYKIIEPRDNKMLEFVVGGGGGAVSSNSPALSAGSCSVGINFAGSAGQDQINEAAELGYGYAQIIVLGTEDPNSVAAQASQICNAGMVPVIRSCYIGSDCFSTGAEQASFLNAVTSSTAWTCSSGVVTCGHNEPVTEYNPNPPAPNTLGSAEGVFTAACTQNIDKKGGSISVTTPIFNGTIATRMTNVSNFLSSFTASGGSVSAFDCLAVNIYEEPASPGSIQTFTNDFLSRRSDFNNIPLCVMETGIVNGTTDGAVNANVISAWLANNSSAIAFALGFNWTNSNPTWSSFALSDRGSATLERSCGITRVIDGQLIPSATIPGRYYTNYSNYLAEGNNWNEYNQYFEALFYLDELAKILDLYGYADAVSSITLITDGDKPRFSSGRIENFVGYFTCDDWETRPELIAALEQARAVLGTEFSPNCIAPDTRVVTDPDFVEDPLGKFLCELGYDVGVQCTRYCAEVDQPTKELGGFSNPSCPMRNESCWQGPLGAVTHYCAGQDPAFDFYSTADSRVYAPEDGEIVFAEGFESYVCSSVIGRQLTEQELINLNANRTVGDPAAAIEAIRARGGNFADIESSGGWLGYLGDSGVFYRLRHLNNNSTDTAGLVGRRFTGGQVLTTATGKEMRLYNVPDNIYTPCWRGAHLHTWGKIETTSPAGSGGQYVDSYQLFGEVLGCGSVNSCTMPDRVCTPPQWVQIDGVRAGSTAAPICEVRNPEDIRGRGPEEQCNEFNCAPGDPRFGSFDNSLACAANTIRNDVQAGKSLALVLDEYGPYCDNETLAIQCQFTQGGEFEPCSASDIPNAVSYRSTMPFVYNFLSLYNTYAPESARCNVNAPLIPRPEDAGLNCTSFGSAAERRSPDNPAWQYYRAPLEACAGPQILSWEAGAAGRTVSQLADDIIANVVYNNFVGFGEGSVGAAVPRAKVIAVLEAARERNINPYILISIWATESWFGKYKPQCNVY